MTEQKAYFWQFYGSFHLNQFKLQSIEGTFEQYKMIQTDEYKHYFQDYSTGNHFAKAWWVLGGAKFIWRKTWINERHKLNNVWGQILLAKRMGKTWLLKQELATV